MVNLISIEEVDEEELIYSPKRTLTIEQEEKYDSLLSIMGKLSTRQRIVLMERYGLVDNSPKTLFQLASKFKINTGKISIIEMKAIETLKQLVKKES